VNVVVELDIEILLSTRGTNSLPFIVMKNPDITQIIGLRGFLFLVSMPLFSLFFLLLGTAHPLVMAASL